MVDFTLSKLTVLMRPTLVQNYIMYWEVKIYTCIFILISSFLHFIRFRISQKHFFTDFVHPFLQGKRTKIIIHTCIQGVIQCTYAIWFQIKLSAEQNNNHKTTKTTKYSFIQQQQRNLSFIWINVLMIKIHGHVYICSVSNVTKSLSTVLDNLCE